MMSVITKMALKSNKFYKHGVRSVEKFILREFRFSHHLFKCTLEVKKSRIDDLKIRADDQIVRNF
jgi:hypothetical protein